MNVVAFLNIDSVKFYIDGEGQYEKKQVDVLEASSIFENYFNLENL